MQKNKRKCSAAKMTRNVGLTGSSRDHRTTLSAERTSITNTVLPSRRSSRIPSPAHIFITANGSGFCAVRRGERTIRCSKTLS